MTVIFVTPSFNHYGCNNYCMDCDMGWIPMNTLEYLQKENEQLKSLNFQVMVKELLLQ